MMKTEYCEALVVGAGPGGACAAAMLAKSGVRTILIDSESEPQHKVGESLLPSTCHGIAASLGIRDKLKEKNFVQKNGALFKWHHSREAMRIDFANYEFLLRHDAAYAYQVPRIEFDTLLVERAKESGAKWIAPVRAQKLLRTNGRVVGIEGSVSASKTPFRIMAKHVILATGSQSLLGNELGKRVFSKALMNYAIYGYWKNCSFPSSPNEGNTIVEAIDAGWLWFIPLCHSKGLASIGLVTKKGAVDSSTSQFAILNEAINNSKMISDLISCGKRNDDAPYDKIRSARDWSYLNSKLAEPGVFLVGDAAGFVDPMISSGVHLATFAASIASKAVKASLENPENEKELSSLYANTLRTEYLAYYRFIRSFYHLGAINRKSPWLVPGGGTSRISSIQDPDLGKLLCGFQNEQLIFPETTQEFVSELQGCFNSLSATPSDNTQRKLGSWMGGEEPLLPFSEKIFDSLTEQKQN